jgi:dihydroorotase
MERHDVVLSVHGEVTDPDVDVFDRERVFVERHLARIVRDFPGLRVVVEHLTTAEAAAFVADAGPNVAATITPQHLLWSRNALFAGGLRPHLYCLPVLKRESHRRALVRAATSGRFKFFLNDSPTPVGSRERMPRRGCYSAPRAASMPALMPARRSAARFRERIRADLINCRQSDMATSV